MLNFNHLYYFYVFVSEGSVSSAARKLRISQPALSAQLKRFERTLGEPLLLRRGRSLELTERGRHVYGYARQMFSISQEMVRDLTGDEGDRIGHPTLQIGVCSQIDSSFALKALAPALPDEAGGKKAARSRVVTGTHEALSAMLRGRLLDILLTVEPVTQDSVEVVRHFKLPVRLLTPASFAGRWKGSSRYLERNVLGTLKLFELGYALPSPETRLRGEIDRFLSENNVGARISAESAEPSTLVRAVAAGAGIGLLPEAYAEEAMRQSRILSFGPKTGFWRHSLYLLARPSPHLEPQLKLLGSNNKN